MTGCIDDDIDARPLVRSRTNAAAAGSRAAGDQGVGGAEVDGRSRRAGRTDRWRSHATAPIEFRLGDVDDSHWADADHGNRVARAESAGSRHLGGQVEAVGHRRTAPSARRHSSGSSVGHAEDRGPGPKVEVLGPATEQERRLRARQRVAVVLESPAEVVRVVAEAELALAARTVGCGHRRGRRPSDGVPSNAVAPPVADRGDDADVLVALDDRERRRRACSVPAYCWVSPRNVCLSVPQIPDASIFRRTAPGSSLSGYGEPLQLEVSGCDEGGGEHV